MSLSILDGRRNFWQWDTGQRLLVGDTTCGEVHYCNGTDDCARVTGHSKRYRAPHHAGGRPARGRGTQHPAAVV